MVDFKKFRLFPETSKSLLVFFIAKVCIRRLRKKLLRLLKVHFLVSIMISWILALIADKFLLDCKILTYSCLFLIKLDIRHLWNPEVMLEKKSEKKLKKKFRNFRSKIFFEQKNRNFRSKKLDIFRNFRSKKILKNQKNNRKMCEKIEIFGNFPPKFRFFHTFFDKFF